MKRFLQKIFEKVYQVNKINKNSLIRFRLERTKAFFSVGISRMLKSKLSNILGYIYAAFISTATPNTLRESNSVGIKN